MLLDWYIFFKVPEQGLGGEELEEGELIQCLAVSPSEETLVASTDHNQIYCMTLSSADLGTVRFTYNLTTIIRKVQIDSSMFFWLLSCVQFLFLLQQKDAVRFELASQLFHSNVISGLDVCIRKPCFVTCSVDKSIHIWNFESRWVLSQFSHVWNWDYIIRHKIYIRKGSTECIARMLSSLHKYK